MVNDYSLHVRVHTYVYQIIKPTDPGVCEEGSMRLAGGQIEQEGRPEVCLNGVWGSICGYGWSELDGFMFCEDLGYTEPGTG